MTESPVDIFLRNTNVLDRVASLAKLFLLSLVGLLLMVVMLFGLDAALTFPAWVRFSLDVLFIVLVIAWVKLAIGWLVRGQYSPRRVARRVEQTLSVPNNAIVNAIDLGEESSDFTSKTLRYSAMDRARSLAAEISPFEIVSFRTPIQASLLATATIAFVLVGWVATPKLVERVLPRYLNPFGNHPAYSLLQFDVAIDPGTVRQGDSVSINVELDGPRLPDAANLILTVSAGHQLVVPMLQQAANRFSVELKDQQSDFKFAIMTTTGASDTFTIEVVPVPQFQRVAVNYQFPEYTGWEAQSRILDGRGIRTLIGTKVELTVESNLKLIAGSLDLDSSSASESVDLRPDPSQPTRVMGDFVVLDQEALAISLVADNDIASIKPWQGRILAQRDQPPQIGIVSPDRFVIAVEGWKIPVRIVARDDIGLDQVQLFAIENDANAEVLASSVSESNGGSHQSNMVVEYEFDLQLMDLKAGDEIKYYATATDHYPSDWPGSEQHLSKTDFQFIRIISQKEYEELARQNYRMEDVLDELAEWQERLNQLREQREEILSQFRELNEQLQSGEGLSRDEQAQLDALRERLEQFEQQARNVAEQLRTRAEQGPIYDFEQTYHAHLRNLAEQLMRQAEQSAALDQTIQNRSDADAFSPEAIQQAFETFEKNQQPFDESSQQNQEGLQQDLEKLAAAAELLQVVAQIQQLIQQQRRIADELSEFRESNSISAEQLRRLKKLGKEQDLLIQEFEDTCDQMMDTAADHEADFPKAANSIRELIEAIRELDVLGDQTRCVQAAFNEQGHDSWNAAESAAQKLESLQCGCDGDSVGDELNELDRPLAIPKPQMSNSLRQLERSLAFPSQSMEPGQHGQLGMGQRGNNRLSNASLVGPHQPGNQRSMARRGRSDFDAVGSAVEFEKGIDEMVPEFLTPDSQNGERRLKSSLRGVPSPYVEHARAYLNRLNEDHQIEK